MTVRRGVSHKIATPPYNGIILVGDKGYITTSVSGLNNYNVYTLDNKTFFGACFGNGTYVITCSNGYIYRSTDAENWDPINVDTSSIGRVFYCGNKFVATGSNGKLWVSTNAITWESFNYGTGISHIYDIAYGNNTVLLVTIEKTVILSNDLINWKTIPMAEQCYGAIYDGNQFVTVGANGYVAATDGDTITFETYTGDTVEGGNTHYESIAYGNNRYVLSGGGGRYAMFTSIGGSIQTGAIGIRDCRYICFGNGVFLVAGYNGRCATSYNGTGWGYTASNALGDGITYYCCCYGG